MISKISKRFFTAGSKLNRIPPSVQFYAKSYNVDLDTINGTGAYNMVTKHQILEHIRKNNLKKVDVFSKLKIQTQTKVSTPNHQQFEDDSDDVYAQSSMSMPLDSSRQAYARNVSHSKQSIPHNYLAYEANATQFLRVCQDAERNFSEIIVKLLTKGLSKVNLPVERIVYNSGKGMITLLSSNLLDFNMRGEEYGQTAKDVHTKTNKKLFVLIGNDNNVVKNVLPNNCVLSLAFSEPTQTVVPMTRLKFDTMDSEFELPMAEGVVEDSFALSQTMRFSISYDAQFIETLGAEGSNESAGATQTANSLLQYLVTVIEDPDLIQL